jgi:hypothetical protein
MESVKIIFPFKTCRYLKKIEIVARNIKSKNIKIAQREAMWNTSAESIEYGCGA